MKEFSPPKQPYEERYVGFNFFRRLKGEAIASATVNVTDDATSPSDVTITLTNPALQTIVGPKVSVWVQGGVSGHAYKITCRIVSVSGAKHELDGLLMVTEE